MSQPVLSKEVLSYIGWKLQLEAYFEVKGIDTDDKKKNSLPLCLSPELLARVATHLSLGTTTYKSALEKIKKMWLEVRRPADPEAQFARFTYAQPSEAPEALLHLQWLAEYLQYDGRVLRRRFIAASPAHLQPILLSRATDTIDMLCDFVAQCPDTPQPVSTVRQIASPKRGQPVCSFCRKSGHSVESCRRRLKLCLRCGADGHFVADCPMRTGKND